MKLKPCLIHVEYDFSQHLRGSKNTKEYKIKHINFLNPDFYSSNTIIDDENDIQITTHYRSKIKSDSTFYQLGFRIECDNGEQPADYSIIKGNSVEYAYNEEYDCFFELFLFKSRRSNGKTMFIPTVAPLEGIAAGGFTVEVKKNGIDKPLIVKKVTVFPSSIPDDDYQTMLSDLVGIQQKIVIANDNAVRQKGYSRYTIDSIMECVNKIEKHMRAINKNPSKTILTRLEKAKYRNIRKYTPKLIFQKTAYPFKDPVAALNYETTAVYENYAVQYALLLLKKRIEQSTPNANDSYIYSDEEISRLLDGNPADMENVKAELESVETQIRNFESAFENNLCEGEASLFYPNPKYWVHFTIHKKTEIKPDSETTTITPDNYEWPRKIKIASNYSKNNPCELSTELEEYYFKKIYPFETKIESANFKNRKFGTITLCSNDIFEYAFFLKKLYSNGDMDIKAIIETDGDIAPNDPLYSLPIKDGYSGTYKLKIVKIISIDNESIPNLNKGEAKRYVAQLLPKGPEHEGLSLKKELLTSAKLKIENFQKSKSYNVETIKRYNEANLKIDSSLKLDFLKTLKPKPVYIRPNQVFVNDPNYFAVWKALKELDTQISFLDGIDETFFTPYPTNKIYELWCYFKMIDMFKELGFVIKNKHAFSKEYLEDTVVKGAKHECSMQKNDINISFIYQNTFLSNTGGKLSPDYTITNNISKTFYIDAKYKNYKTQGRLEYIKDLNEVAINKYLLRSQNTPSQATASFILHPDTNYGAYFGGYIKYNLLKNINWDNSEPPDHKFGSFAFLPSNLLNMKTFIKLMLEYHLGFSNRCFNCGTEQPPSIKPGRTASGYVKYHITCPECGEFWVSTHCDCGYETGSAHKLYKRKINYHYEDKGTWYVFCPKKSYNYNDNQT